MTPRRVAVAATGRQAVDAGLAAASDGGNAVDAALAAAMVAMVTEPGMVSLAGGCYVAIWPHDGPPVVVDGNVEMPGRGLPAHRFGMGVREVVTGYGGGVTMHAGPGSVATPGVVPAFGRAVEGWGRLPWARIVTPAEAVCRDGYPMSSASANYLAVAGDVLFADLEARAVVTGPDGGPLAAGQPARNLPLARTLERLAEEGPALMSSGAVAIALADDQARSGGLVTRSDLASYTPVVRDPVLRRVGDWEVALNPPPAVGGVMLAVMMSELARRGEWTWLDAIEIQRAVLSHRVRVHDLSEDLDADGHELLAAVERNGLERLPRSPSTAHVSAVDRDGTACAVTMSSGYHSGTVIPGTGILLNNALGETELNRRGLHALAPGTRLASNMAPTTARNDDGRVLAIGSPGADRITTALMAVLGQACLHHADLGTAILAPRVHVRIGDGDPVVEYERDAGLAAAVAASGLRGHEYAEPHMYFGGVGAAQYDVSGLLQAFGDPRRTAAVGVTPGPPG